MFCGSRDTRANADADHRALDQQVLDSGREWRWSYKPGMTKVAVVVDLRARNSLEGEQWKSTEGSNLGLREGWLCGEEDTLRQRLCYLSLDPMGVKQKARKGWQCEVIFGPLSP